MNEAFNWGKGKGRCKQQGTKQLMKSEEYLCGKGLGGTETFKEDEVQ